MINCFWIYLKGKTSSEKKVKNFCSKEVLIQLNLNIHINFHFFQTCRYCTNPDVDRCGMSSRWIETFFLQLRCNVDEAGISITNRCQIQKEDRNDCQVIATYTILYYLQWFNYKASSHTLDVL